MAENPQLSGRRIQIIGVVGAGKTTFARQLGEELSIAVCELDPLFHESKAGGSLSAEDAKRTIQALVDSNNEWIIDGNHWVQLKDISYNRATDILWIDTPLPLTLWRVITRTIWEILTIRGVLSRELSGDSLILMSVRSRAKKYANWSKRSEVDPRWKRLDGWFGPSRFLANVRETRRASESRRKSI